MLIFNPIQGIFGPILLIVYFFKFLQRDTIKKRKYRGKKYKRKNKKYISFKLLLGNLNEMIAMKELKYDNKSIFSYKKNIC